MFNVYDDDFRSTMAGSSTQVRVLTLHENQNGDSTIYRLEKGNSFLQYYQYPSINCIAIGIPCLLS